MKFEKPEDDSNDWHKERANPFQNEQKLSLFTFSMNLNGIRVRRKIVRRTKEIVKGYSIGKDDSQQMKGNGT